MIFLEVNQCQYQKAQWYNHKFLTILPQLYWEQWPSLTPKEGYHLAQVGHRKPWNISENIGQRGRKSTHQECRNTSIHKERNCWSSEEICERSDERKRAKIKERNGKCTNSRRDGKRHSFVKKCSEKREKFRQLFPKRNNTDNRKKRELKSDIIGKWKWIQDGEYHSDHKRQEKCRKTISPEARTIPDDAHECSSPHRRIASDEEHKPSYCQSNDSNPNPWCHRTEKKWEKNYEHHDIWSTHDHDVHETRSLEVFLEFCIEIILLPEDDTREYLLSSRWENLRELLVKPCPHSYENPIFLGGSFIDRKGSKFCNNLSIAELFFRLIFRSITRKGKTPKCGHTIARHQWEIRWHRNRYIYGGKSFVVDFGNCHTVFMGKFTHAKELSSRTSDGSIVALPAHTSTEIFSCLVDGMNCVDGEHVASKENYSYSEKNFPTFPKEDHCNKYQKNYQPKTRFRPNISDKNTREKGKKKIHSITISFQGKLQGVSLIAILIMSIRKWFLICSIYKNITKLLAYNCDKMFWLQILGRELYSDKGNWFMSQVIL